MIIDSQPWERKRDIIFFTGFMQGNLREMELRCMVYENSNMGMGTFLFVSKSKKLMLKSPASTIFLLYFLPFFENASLK